MASNFPMASNSTVYIGNLDERVSERVLYDILIEAGRVVDLHIPRDKDSDRPKGYAFAEYETPQIASYAVSLFSGLLTLHNRTLKFAISGQDKVVSQKSGTSSNSKGRSHPNDAERISASFRFSSNSNYNTQVHSISNSHSRRVFGFTLDASSTKH